MNKKKYPRTYHLPWSLGKTDDDKILKNINHFIGKQIIVTEKLDGENTSIYNFGLHARSLDSANHESQHWVKNFISTFQFQIPNNMRICGENVFASHSIFYDKLTSYFFAFSVWDENTCLSWDDTQYICQTLNIQTVPVLYKGIWDESIIKQLYTGISKFGTVQEGYVVRIADEFDYKHFNKCVAKFVRTDHVQTNNHWKSSTIIPNKLVN